VSFLITTLTNSVMHTKNFKTCYVLVFYLKLRPKKGVTLHLDKYSILIIIHIECTTQTPILWAGTYHVTIYITPHTHTHTHTKLF
jgi:hypothetical protein